MNVVSGTRSLDWLRVPLTTTPARIAIATALRVISFEILDFGVSASVEGF